MSEELVEKIGRFMNIIFAITFTFFTGYIAFILIQNREKVLVIIEEASKGELLIMIFIFFSISLNAALIFASNLMRRKN